MFRKLHIHQSFLLLIVLSLLLLQVGVATARGDLNQPIIDNATADQQIEPPDPPPDDPGPDDLGPDTPIVPQRQPAVPLAVVGGTWLAQGAGPSQNGQVEGSTMTNLEVSGAIHTVVAHPTDADILYAGAANGGIWKTSNATNASPTWTPLTDDKTSLSIGALELDPTDGTYNTLVAGIGRYSAYGQHGGARTGLLRTTDGGDNWTELTALAGKNISGVAPRGSTIVVSVNYADSYTCGNIGIFRSTDTGASFSQSATLRGAAFDLAGDPTNNAILYSGLTYVSTCAGGTNGIYKSTDTGANWTKVSNDTMDGLIVNSTTNNIEIATRGNHVYVNILQDGQSVGVFYSGNGGASWSQMDLPRLPAHAEKTISSVVPGNPIQIDTSANHLQSTGDQVEISEVGGTTGANGIFTITKIDDDSFTLDGSNDATAYTSGGKWHKVVGMNPRVKPGGQGGIHASILVDPTTLTTVYLGGDRQDGGQDGSLPNYIGAQNWTGVIMRGDATQTANGQVPSPQWEHMTHLDTLTESPLDQGGTANTSAPHADSREMVFDANGDIIEGDDGGINRHTNPTDNTGDWYPLNGNLQVTEMHDVAYDNLNNMIISGNQDTGTTYQTTIGGSTWNSLSTGDGGDVAVDNIELSGSSQSVRYSSSQNLSYFRRSIWNVDGTKASHSGPALTVTGGGADYQAQFVNPIATNNVAGGRLILGGYNSIYESTDGGATIQEVGVGLRVNARGSHPIDYGGMKTGDPNPNVIYAATGSTNISVRTAAGASFATTSVADDNIYGVVMDPEDYDIAYAIDDDQVFKTTNTGGAWTDVTGTLSDNFRSIAIASGQLFVGGLQGVYVMDTSAGAWNDLGAGLPNAPVWDLDYDATDKVLVAGTLGRSAWLMPIPDDWNAPTVYAGATLADCASNAPCLVGGGAIQDAMNAMGNNGTLYIAGSFSVDSSLTSGNSGANNVTIQGSTGTMNSGINFTGSRAPTGGNGFNVSSGSVTVTGINISGAATAFNQTGGTLTAYANNITGWTTAYATSGGSASLGNNWWGSASSAYDASDPGLPTGDWGKRLGADIASWNIGADSATLGNASLSGGTGAAVIVSHGRDLANAPFGNGVSEYADDMCSDFYDFFVRSASGSWDVTVPVDSNDNCNDNTLNQNKLGYIPDISECATTNPACWDTAPSVSQNGQNLVSSGLSVAQLNGTPFVAGDDGGRDPTAIILLRLEVTETTASIPAGAVGLLLLIWTSVIFYRRWRA